MASPLHGSCSCASPHLLSSRTRTRFSLPFNNKITAAPLCDDRLQRTPRCCRVASMIVFSAMTNSNGANWWKKDGGPNMMDVHSATELTDAIASAGDKLVIVEFYATWCGSCRALYPKLCRIAAEHADMLFLKVNFDENKPLCKSLNIKVLPYFHFYRGAEGLLDAFSCSISKLQKLKDAISVHSTERGSIGPPAGLELETVETSGRNIPDEAAPTGTSI